MNFEESQTKINLARAFAGECQGGARYQFIAQKAMQENKKNLVTTVLDGNEARASMTIEDIKEILGINQL